MSKTSLSVLFVGETNIVHMIEHKGLDAFELTRYTEFATPVGPPLVLRPFWQDTMPTIAP